VGCSHLHMNIKDTLVSVNKLQRVSRNVTGKLGYILDRGIEQYSRGSSP